MAETTTRTPHRTYRGPGDRGAPRLAALPGVSAPETEAPQVLETERWDTDDRRLAAAGIALALYRGGADGDHWQLDLPDGDGTERLRLPLPPDAVEPPSVPDELDMLVRGAARQRAVRPAGRVRTVRTATGLRGTDGRELGTVVHDHVTLATLGRSTDVDSWTEVALRDVDGALLAELEQRLAEIGLRPARYTAEAELDRLLHPAPAPRRRPAGKKSSAGAVLLGYLAEHAARLAAEDLRVRRDEPDSVHQMRVASRRIRSALQAYRPLLDRARTESLVDELRELGRALAPARDAEVLAMRISAGLAALPPELLLGPVQAQVVRRFARLEAEARAAVLTALDGDRYAALRRDLDDLLERPPLTRRGARKARTELPAVAGRTARRLDRAVTTAVDARLPAAERDAAVHTARKAGKRLRYATEVAQPVVGTPAKQFTRALKGFQAALGEHQDTVVARETLRELGALAHAAGENGFSFGVLYGQDGARAARIEEELPALWAQAWNGGKGKHRRWLG